MSNEYTDISYRTHDGLAWIVINRPERYNAFRATTIDQLIWAFKRAWADKDVGVVALRGAGDKAFCTGGDQKQRAETGDYGPSESGLFEVEMLHRLIRDIPKPVIAAVNGFAIGGGHVLHLLCDLTVAADHAKFGQTGPKVGSFDAGFGTAYMARVIGEKRAREVWYTCRQYTASTMQEWGLVNEVVPLSGLDDAVRSLAAEMLDKSPTALRVCKASFNAASDHIAGISSMGFTSLDLFVKTDEAMEGARAFAEKRSPDFGAFRD